MPRSQSLTNKKALKHTFPGVLKDSQKIKVFWLIAKIPLLPKYDTSIIIEFYQSPQ